MPMKNKHSTVALFLLIALTRVFGLMRSIILARIWGSGINAAAFELSQTVSAFLYDTCISTVIAVMFIPAYVARRGENAQDQFISSLLFPTFLISVILYLPLIVFPETVLSVIAPDTAPTLLKASAPVLSLTSIGRVTLSLSCLLVSVMQSENQAVTAAGFYCLSSLISTVASAIFSKLLTAFSLSSVLAVLDIGLLLALTASVRKRHAVSMTLSRRFTITRPMIWRAFWVILSGIFLPLLTLLASLSSASIGGSEGVSLIGYSSKLVLLTAALLTSVTHAAYYAAMAKANNKQKALRSIIIKLLLLSSAATVALLILADPIVSLLYRGSALSQEDMKTLVYLLSLYAPSVIALTLSSLLSDFAYLSNQTAHVAISNLSAIGLTALVFYLIDASALWQIPLFFTLSAYLRLIFTAVTVLSKPDRNKPRLLLVLSDANIGGAGRWLLTYLRTADTSCFDICVALPEHAALEPEIRSLGFPVYTMGSERSFSIKNTLLALKLMLKLRPDVVNTSASLSARIASTLTRVPVRLYTRHCVYKPSPVFRWRAVRIGHRLLSRLLSPNTVAVAPEAKDNLVAMGLSPKRICVIANGVFPVPYNQTAASLIRKSFHITSEPTVAICVRLEKDKSVHTLIEAIAHLKKQNHAFHALIVGCGSEEAFLKDLAIRTDVADRVHFCGFVSDVSPYLSAADIYANCSVGSEATSLAIAEAMSLSLPIVASDYGGNPHMVKDGSNGIIVRQNDPRELADALLILSDKALLKKFGKASYRRYTACYRAEIMAREYESLYRTLLHRKGYRIV